MTDDGSPQTAVEWAWEISTHYKGSVRMVLLAMAIAYKGKGACLSVKDLTEQANVSDSSVRRAIVELTENQVITTIVNGGDERKTGTTNCYRFVDFEPPEMKPLSFEGGSLEPLSSNETPFIDTPLPFDEPETSTSEYAGAAGEKESVKEQKEFVLSVKNNQTDSLKVIDTRTDAQESAWADPGKIAPPREQPVVSPSKPVLPASEQQNAPNPGSAAPLPPPLPDGIERAYVDKFAYNPVLKEQDALRWMVQTHGVDFAKRQIESAKLTDAQNVAIQHPMCYVKKALEADAARGKKPVYIARSHSQETPKEKVYGDASKILDFMKKQEVSGVTG